MERASSGRHVAEPPRAIYRHAHWYVLSLLLVVFAGFFKTYFTRLSSTDLIHHLHAATAIGWILLLAAQSYAIAHGRMAWHRSIAKLAFILLPLLIVTGLFVLHAMLARHPLQRGSVVTHRAFADFASLLFLVTQFSMGIVFRRDVRQHQRFMTATVFALFPPALARVIGLDLALRLGPWNLVINHAVGLVIVAMLLVRDWRRERCIYFAYGYSLAFFMVLMASVPLLMHNNDWFQFCRWFAGQGG